MSYVRKEYRSTYRAARGRCGGLAQEAGVCGTGSRVTSSRAGGNTAGSTVGGHGHDASSSSSATREVVGSSACNLRAHAGVGSGKERSEVRRSLGWALRGVGGEERRSLARVVHSEGAGSRDCGVVARESRPNGAGSSITTKRGGRSNDLSNVLGGDVAGGGEEENVGKHID